MRGRMHNPNKFKIPKNSSARSISTFTVDLSYPLQIYGTPIVSKFVRERERNQLMDKAHKITMYHLTN